MPLSDVLDVNLLPEGRRVSGHARYLGCPYLSVEAQEVGEIMSRRGDSEKEYLTVLVKKR